MRVEAGVELKTGLYLEFQHMCFKKKFIPLDDSIWLKSTRSSKRSPYNYMKAIGHWGTGLASGLHQDSFDLFTS